MPRPRPTATPAECSRKYALLLSSRCGFLAGTPLGFGTANVLPVAPPEAPYCCGIQISGQQQLVDDDLDVPDETDHWQCSDRYGHRKDGEPRSFVQLSLSGASASLAFQPTAAGYGAALGTSPLHSVPQQKVVSELRLHERKSL